MPAECIDVIRTRDVVHTAQNGFDVHPLPPLVPADDLLAVMSRRRSIRRLRSGPWTEAIVARLLEAVRLTPAAYNQPPWHIVLIDQRADAFWAVVEAAFHERLEGERLARYLGRLAGFRTGVATILIYEDLSSRDALQAAWQITPDQARSFAEQGLGMVQLALWLALTAEGLVTSLQHWDWLLDDRLADFLDLPSERYRLAAAMPLGYPDEAPRPTERAALHRVVSRDHFAGHDTSL